MKIEIEPVCPNGDEFDITVTTEDMDTPREITEFSMSFGVKANSEVEALDKAYIDMMLALRAFFKERRRSEKVLSAAQVLPKVKEFYTSNLDKSIADEFNQMLDNSQDFSVLGDK